MPGKMTEPGVVDKKIIDDIISYGKKNRLEL